MTPAGALPDADLVTGVLAGDRLAFAGVYERYADRLHDFAFSMLRNREEAADCVADSFVVMAEKLAQLRDRSRLRPWLYSVVRNECLRTLRARAREAHDDEWLEAMPDQASGPEDQVADAEVTEELQALVWSAVEGLNDRDRALIDLHLRQGLEGAELAAAMDVTPANAYVMLSRARDQVERALGALLVARRGSDDCDELASVLSGWDGTFSPLIRKRVARHIDGCETCTGRRRLMVSPLALLAGVPAFAAPLALRERVLDDERLVAFYVDLPVVGPPAARSRRGLAAVGGVLLLLLGVLAVVLLWPDGADTENAVDPLPTSSAPTTPPVTATTAAPAASAVATPDAPSSSAPTTASSAPSSAPTSLAAAPGDLRASTRSVDLGGSGTSRTVRLTNAGGSPVPFTARSRASWLSVPTAGGTVAAGSSAGLRVVASRAGLGEGTHRGEVAVTWSGGTIVVTVTLSVNRPPVVDAIATSGTDCTITVSAQVTDGSGVRSVQVRWSGAVSGQKAAGHSGSTWSTSIGPIGTGGALTVTFTATDRGGLTSSRSRTFTVNPCPG
ncbi:sigma-70 family RNA polymerase sigma factor [Nocardioides sp. LML1-1-1.1]|uniref:sigma-70 family RNA polymerase sigma factor n=1 Tax=Nocardioides sp. LML1-1-1.1 TaxID=3135248 RepID=UPI00341E22BE